MVGELSLTLPFSLDIENWLVIITVVYMDNWLSI